MFYSLKHMKAEGLGISLSDVIDKNSILHYEVDGVWHKLLSAAEEI